MTNSTSMDSSNNKKKKGKLMERMKTRTGTVNKKRREKKEKKKTNAIVIRDCECAEANLEFLCFINWYDTNRVNGNTN